MKKYIFVDLLLEPIASLRSYIYPIVLCSNKQANSFNNSPAFLYFLELITAVAVFLLLSFYFSIIREVGK